MIGAANGEMMRTAGLPLETISAAATAIASAGNRASQASSQKRRWGSCFSIYWCFGSKKKNKRIGHAVFDPETRGIPGNVHVAQADNPTGTTTTFALPFVAPPSSPVSFIQSEPPSATQSPVGLISFSSMSANMYSPGGPASIFAIGPYAHETQLVSPPVFSTFTTEPSTAPFTPPPELVHLTTPSSPEVPFAKLLDPNLQNGNMLPLSRREFQSYQLHPGSPISRLLSPASAISGSGTSSPFPDREFYDMTPDSAGPWTHNKFKFRHQNSDICHSNSYNKWRNVEAVSDHRVSFEVTAEDFVRCIEKNPRLLSKDRSVTSPEKVWDSTAKAQGRTGPSPGGSLEKNRSITLGSPEEFNFFDNGNEDVSETGSVAGPCPGPEKWSFFPMMMQPG
ncbi:unnamed protein product [Cuscuta campestris]|uniref:Uncharacterized protein n=2 Tax=Cuscuta sect. Cleistogrammica TaxID=1824901 RepID=A0A484KZA0_9ASTE|nr:hypothetical protein DM860_005414 [Cuscuta australis]VFQ68046.1 unnamed protein product [Cuscuta campestris]